MIRLLKSVIFLSLASLVFAVGAEAQSIPGITEPVALVMSPESPRPELEVTITAQSYSTDLNRATFLWYVNGKIFKQGVGITEITVPGTKSGVTTRVSATIRTVDIGTIEQGLSWAPAEVTLVWQTDGYIPPFYKAKSLEVYGSAFKVTAIPEFFTANGKRINPSTLVYTWKKNGVVQGESSGYGKTSFSSSQSSYIRGGDTISVEVGDVTKNTSATRSITISPTVPELVLYENSPLYGIRYENSLRSSLNLTSEEMTIYAEPYYISSAGPVSNSLAYEWQMNGVDVPEFSNKNSITLRRTGSVGGQSTINLSLQHAQRVLQGGQAVITILQ